VYHEALEREFQLRGIPYQRQVEICIYYKGEPLACTYRADFICYGEIVLELKAIKQLTDIDRAQTINYLRATRFHRGLLVNFGAPSLEYERLAN
jgi:GxxExxY protein